MALRREIGDYYYETEALDLLGDCYLTIGDGAAARSVWQQAAAIYEDLEHPDAEAMHAKLRDLAAQLS